MASLDKLLALKPSRLYPAHGEQHPTPEAAETHLRRYIAHRKDRENQVLAMLADQPHTIDEIVEKIYNDPIDTIKKAAAASVRATLDKLASERKVSQAEDAWQLHQTKEVDGVDKRA